MVPIRWWWQRSRIRAEGHLVHLAEGHRRTMSGEGGGDFPKHSCVLIQLLSTTCQTIHNSLAGVEISLCGDSDTVE